MRAFLAKITWCFFVAVITGLAFGQSLPSARVPVDSTITDVLTAEDTDHDGLVTTMDCGPKRIQLITTEGAPLLVEGTFAIGNLLQELGTAKRIGRVQIEISAPLLYQDPAARVAFMIRERYWDWLTRTIDEIGIARLLEDSKVSSSGARVYVPHDDDRAWDYFTQMHLRRPELRFSVVRLPRVLTPQFVRSINTQPGILTLEMRRVAAQQTGTPFVVPGGRFNEMYGWDSYFIALGLIADDRVDLARSMVDNLVYEIKHYGKILNANRTYYLTRSQPPFLTSMVIAVFERLPRTDQSRAWLARSLRAAIREYESVWTVEPHLTKTGLSRYFGTGIGIPPEVEPGHFSPIVRPLAEAARLPEADFERRYSDGELESPQLDAMLMHDRAMRESGHDTSYRLLGRAANLNSVALNALLFKYESDLHDIIHREFGGKLELDDGKSSLAEVWSTRAATRQARMMDLLWDETRGLFFDYDFVAGTRISDVSATTFYPLWAGMLDQRTGEKLARTAMQALEEPGGIVAGTEESRGSLGANRPPRQWDYPFGWAPHQVIAWRALERCGLNDDARRLAYRWVYMIAMNAARSNGAIVEKYDVVQRSIDASAEYGNVGTRFRLVPDGGFAWTNASYQIGLSMLDRAERESMSRLIPPEWMYGPINRSNASLPGTHKR